MNRIDRRLLELGFIKKEENKHGVTYERIERKYNYVQEVDIIHKQSNKHLIFSYEKNLINKDGFNNVVGLTYKETKLFMKKYKQMKRKYKWSDYDD